MRYVHCQVSKPKRIFVRASPSSTRFLGASESALPPKWHLDRFIRFCTVHPRVQRTSASLRALPRRTEVNRKRDAFMTDLSLIETPLTPPEPTRQNCPVASRRRRRCELNSPRGLKTATDRKSEIGKRSRYLKTNTPSRWTRPQSTETPIVSPLRYNSVDDKLSRLFEIPADCRRRLSSHRPKLRDATRRDSFFASCRVV